MIFRSRFAEDQSVSAYSPGGEKLWARRAGICGDRFTVTVHFKH